MFSIHNFIIIYYKEELKNYLGAVTGEEGGVEKGNLISVLVTEKLTFEILKVKLQFC